MPFGQVISRLFHDFFRSADWTFSCAVVILILCADFVFLWHIISRKGFPLTQIMAALPGIYTANKKDGSTYYRASITYLKKHISLGSFATEELASRTYREARLILDHAEITLSDYSLFSCQAYPADLFNHESERRGETFVTRKITLAASRIAQGLQKKLYLPMHVIKNR